MPRRRPISRSQQEAVRRRAQGLCEYCHTAEQWQYVLFTVDHIVPISQGSGGTLDNLALACFHCNRRKADRLQAVDSESNALEVLFHPRQHRWGEHFVWSADGLQSARFGRLATGGEEADDGQNQHRHNNQRHNDEQHPGLDTDIAEEPWPLPSQR